MEVLVQGLMGAHDQAVASPAVQAHVEAVLRRVGVVRVDSPVGALFDGLSQTAVATEPARHPDEVSRVARQVRPGWSRAGVALRPVEVVVWA